ncbi:MAG TPA: TIGR01777 family protein [Syntrophobacteraceae bacterium]|nr:TIGR01777 family protein [Syntrophobacteraceae bacterium]
MRVFITGGTGFVGTFLVRELTQRGHQVWVLTRKAKGDSGTSQGVTFVTGDPTQPGPWQEQAAQCTAFVNLAGASIFTYWTDSAKQRMRDSRLLTTRHLVDAIRMRAGEPGVLVNASAVGYYGPREDDQLLEENSPPGNDFLAGLARDWEQEARRAADADLRVVLCRFGIVLGKEGGALAKMVPAFRKWLGSPLGSGRQWFPWVHQEDLAHIVLFALEHTSLDGPVNCVAPYPVRNRELTEILARSLNRSVILPAVPAFILRMVLGEFGNVLLKGQRVYPTRLLSEGFEFRYPTLQAAMSNLLGM